MMRVLYDFALKSVACGKNDKETGLVRGAIFFDRYLRVELNPLQERQVDRGINRLPNGAAKRLVADGLRIAEASCCWLLSNTQTSESAGHDPDLRKEFHYVQLVINRDAQFTGFRLEYCIHPETRRLTPSVSIISTLTYDQKE